MSDNAGPPHPSSSGWPPQRGHLAGPCSPLRAAPKARARRNPVVHHPESLALDEVADASGAVHPLEPMGYLCLQAVISDTPISKRSTGALVGCRPSVGSPDRTLPGLAVPGRQRREGERNLRDNPASVVASAGAAGAEPRAGSSGEGGGEQAVRLLHTRADSGQDPREQHQRTGVRSVVGANRRRAALGATSRRTS